MKVVEALDSVRRLYLDTAPLIYYIEEHPAYISIMTDVLEMVTKRDITIVTSVITLTEVLVKPFEAGHTELAKSYKAILSNAENTELHAIGMDVAEHAACAQSWACARQMHSTWLLLSEPTVTHCLQTIPP